MTHLYMVNSRLRVDPVSKLGCRKRGIKPTLTPGFHTGIYIRAYIYKLISPLPSTKELQSV